MVLYARTSDISTPVHSFVLLVICGHSTYNISVTYLRASANSFILKSHTKNIIGHATRQYKEIALAVHRHFWSFFVRVCQAGMG